MHAVTPPDSCSRASQVDNASALEQLADTPRTRRLIENRICYAGPHAELSIYDTWWPAQDVALSAERVLYCGMLQGRKVMNGATDTPETFLPGESFVLAPHQEVRIDFPDAHPDAPTTCLTIDLDPARIHALSERLNQTQPRERELGEWHYHPQALHVPHSPTTQALIERLMGLFRENHPDRDALIGLGIDELIVRLLRTQSRELLLADARQAPPRHGLAAALSWLERHPELPLDGAQLAREACMSKARLYRLFQREVGYTPGEYQQRLRLARARQWLREADAPITEICYSLGYRSLSHFTRRFKAAYGLTPGDYRRLLIA